MASRSVIFAILIAVPAIAGAQRGTAGGMGGGAGGINRGSGHAPSISRSDGLVVPKLVNAVNLLIAHRQDLSLSDTQFKRVIVVKREVDSTNSPLMRSLDSLQAVYKSTTIFERPGAARRDSLVGARAFMNATIGAVRENDNNARDKAYALLSASQLAKAQDLESQAQHAIDDETEKTGRGGKPPV